MSVTLGNLGAGESLVGTPASTTLATKSIEVDKNITLSSSATDVTFTYNTPACRLRDTAVPDLINGASANIEYDTEIYDPTNMHDTMTNPDRVTIATAGLYFVSFNIVFEPASTPTGNAVIRIYRNSTVIADSSEYLTASPWQRLICSTVAAFSASDYIVTQWVNQCGVTLACIESSENSPVLSVCRVGEN